MLQVNFNQTQTNSFSFVYSYSNMDCDGKILTTSAGGIKTTTTTTTKMKVGSRIHRNDKIQMSEIIHVQTQPISDASGISTIPTTGDSTTSSSVGEIDNYSIHILFDFLLLQVLELSRFSLQYFITFLFMLVECDEYSSVKDKI